MMVAIAIQGVCCVNKTLVLNGFSDYFSPFYVLTIVDDISEVLNVHQQGNIPCELVQSILQEKIDKLEAQIWEMTVFKNGLEQYRESWAASETHPKPGDICPLIETLPLGT